MILSQIKYQGRRRSLDFKPNPDIVISGDDELRLMRKQKKKYGKFLG